MSTEELFKEWVRKWFGQWADRPAASYYDYYRQIWNDARKDLEHPDDRE